MMTIDLVASVYTGGELLRRALDTLPIGQEGVNLYIGDDMSPPAQRIEIATIARAYGADIVRYEYPENEFSAPETSARTVERGNGDIILFYDEDSLWPIGIDLAQYLRDIFSEVYNAVLFPLIIQRYTSGAHSLQAHGQIGKRFSSKGKLHPNFTTSSFDSACAIRRDFLEAIGGLPRGVGYGSEREDLCRRVLRGGGAPVITPDLAICHIENDATFVKRTPRTPEEPVIEQDEMNELRAKFRWIHPAEKSDFDSSAIEVVQVEAGDYAPAADIDDVRGMTDEPETHPLPTSTQQDGEEE